MIKDKIVAISFFCSILFCLMMCSGCVEQERPSNSDAFVFDIKSIDTRLSYDNTIYRQSVLEVEVKITNKDVKPGVYDVKFFIDDFLEDEERVSLSPSEDTTIILSNIDDGYTEYPLDRLHLETAGNHTLRIGPLTRNITVNPPVLDLTLDGIEWRSHLEEGYIPWITLTVSNPTDDYFFLGGSFGLGTSDGLIETKVEEWNLLQGEVNTTGFYKFPAGGVAQVVLTSFDLITSMEDGSDVSLEYLWVFAGFPWLDFTGGIIGEYFFSDG